MTAIIRQQLCQQEQHDNPAGVIRRARRAHSGVNVGEKHNSAMGIGAFAGNDIAAFGGDALGPAFQDNLLARMLGQPMSFFVGHVDGWNVEIAVFDEGKWIHGAHHLPIPCSGGDDGPWLLCLQQLDDPLVPVRVVEREVLGHQLLFGDIPAQQDDLVGDIGSL